MSEINEEEIAPGALTSTPQEQLENLPSQQIIYLQSEEQLENSSEETEMVKISKIYEGIYLGDKFLSQNPNFMIPYKITHIINVSGEKFTFQNEEISYQILNITWEESPNQVLLDKEDSISSEIQIFIDDCVNSGGGLLIYSIKGKNRACIIVLIYLMRKYNWSLEKGLEFLKAKKPDMQISDFFLDQLADYEKKLLNNNNKISDKWINVNIKDNYEAILTNTFINGFLIKTFPTKICAGFPKKNLHVGWGDNNPYNYETYLTCYNFQDDLYFKKDVKDILSHKIIKPMKSCIKKYMVRGYTVQKITEPSRTNKNIEEKNHVQLKSNNKIILNNGNQNDINNIRKMNFEGQINNVVSDSNSLIFDNIVKKNNSTVIKKNNIKNINNKIISKVNRIKGANKILSIRKQISFDSEQEKKINSLIKNDMDNKIILNFNKNNDIIDGQKTTQNIKINNNYLLPINNGSIIKNYKNAVINKSNSPIINRNISVTMQIPNKMNNSINYNIKNDSIIKFDNPIQQYVQKKNINNVTNNKQNYHYSPVNNNRLNMLNNNNLKKIEPQRFQSPPNQIIINVNEKIINNTIQNNTIQNNIILNNFIQNNSQIKNNNRTNQNQQIPKPVTMKKKIPIQQTSNFSPNPRMQSQKNLRHLQMIRPMSPQLNQKIEILQTQNSSQIIHPNLGHKNSFNGNSNNSFQNQIIINNNNNQVNFKEDVSEVMRDYSLQTKNNNILNDVIGRQTWSGASSKLNNKLAKNFENFVNNNYSMPEQSIIINKNQNVVNNESIKTYVVKKIPHDKINTKNYQINNFNINDNVDKGYYNHNTMKNTSIKARLFNNWMNRYDNNNNLVYYNINSNKVNEDINYGMDNKKNFTFNEFTEKRPSAPAQDKIENSNYKNGMYGTII